jgi:hypothetical protein
VEAPEERKSAPAAWPVTIAIVLVGIALRSWRLGAHSLSFDETFTAMAARRNPGELFAFLRLHDAHPPLDYLLRMPFAGAGSDVLLRLPSVVLSSAALVIFALWMRDRGRTGLIATALVAVSGFEIFYGREARMYALMELVGVVVAVGTDRWLRSRRPGAAAVVSAALLVGVFTHISALVLAAGVFWAAGLARERSAWIWRAGVTAPVLIWAGLWGPTFVDQVRASPASWIPRTTLDSLLQSVAQPVTFTAGLAALIVLVVIGGAVVAGRRDRRLACVLIVCWVVPVVLAATLGRFGSFLQPRTLAFAAWAPLLAISAVLDEVLRRWRLAGVAAVALVAAVVLGSTVDGVERPGLDAVDTTVAHIASVVRPGDEVAIRPVWMQSLIEWNIGVRRGGAHAVRPPLPGTFALALGGTPTGRVWLVEADGDLQPIVGDASCGRPWSDGSTHIRCVRVRS